MGYLEMHFRSIYLRQMTTLAAYIPDPPFRKVMSGATPEEIYRPGIKFPTLFLMHGGGQDCTDWFRNTRVMDYANQKGLLLVSTNVGGSFCTDQVMGLPYFSFYTKEFMPLVRSILPSSPDPEDTFVAGFSMGGHCAMKVALRCPERFNAVFAMSGAKDMVKMQKLAMERGMSDGKSEELTFGPIDSIYGSENDLLHLAAQLGKSDGHKPMIYTSCGQEDYGIELCTEFKAHLDACGLQNEFFTPHGVHNMECADEMIRKGILELFQIRDPWEN